MTGFQAVLNNYIQGVNNDVVGKTDVNSVDTSDVGNIGIILGNVLKPFINAINAFTFYSGTANPDDLLGAENDVYYQTNGGTSIILWRKTTSTWVVQTTIPLGISYQDGIIIGLRTQIDLDSRSVSITAGNWAINNIIYSKSTPTFINYNTPENGSNRIDTIYANELGNILYLAGAPSATPTKPTLPINTIEVDSIYVPASGTGSAYLFTQGVANEMPSNINNVSFNNADVSNDGAINYTLPLGKTLIATRVDSVIDGVPSTTNLNASYVDGVIYGFNKLSGADTQNITLKIA